MVREIAVEECKTIGEAYDEGHQQGREDTLNELREKINRYLEDSWDFADFVVTDNNIDRVIGEMKGEI